VSYRRFSDCSVSERLLYTLFIGLLATGYAFAMVLIFITVAPVDGEPGLSVKDITIKYHGSRSNTRLEQALAGIMKQNRTEAEFKTIVSWIRDGGSEARFAAEIRPILTERCVKCHNPGSGMGIPDLTGYENVMPLVRVDTGESIGALVKVSHIHLLGLGMFFYLLGRIFILTEMPVALKRTIVVIPFAAIAVDIGSWWFTKYSVNIFAYAVMIGGGLMGVSFVFQALVSLYQMWFFKDRFERRYERSGGAERRGEYRRRGEG
jgi:hypothetical protein